MTYTTDIHAIERNADAAARAYARAPADPEGSLAAEIESEAAKVQARIQVADLFEIVNSEALAEMVRAGKLDDAGREFARLVAAHCADAGAWLAGVQ